jgi:hypothetical protein
MARNMCLALISVVVTGLAMANATWAQKTGGVLKIQHMDTPPSASYP